MMDKWEDIFRELNIDCTQPVKYVTAAQIKEITKKEPRNMASMPSEKVRPKIFRDLGVFIVPVSIDKYAIIHGNGYHELEDPGEPQKFPARFPFDMVMLAFGEGENRHLLNAYHSGLLSHFSGVSQMYDVWGGRLRGSFEFRVDNRPPLIPVNGAQIEIDKGFESPTVNDILLFEAKASLPKTFIIRQLYFPYRALSEVVKKNVRTFFFAPDPKSDTYNIWEYEWKEDPLDYEGIKLVKTGSFILDKEKPPVEALETVEPDKTLDIVPQADDFQKVADYPLLILAGIDTGKAWSERQGIARRQGDYYKQAAQALGLLDIQGGSFVLTDAGRKYVNMELRRRSDFLAERMLKIPLMNEVFRLVQRKRTDGVAREEISRLIERRGFSGTTPPRRAMTVLSWFRWLGRATGVVVVHEGRIYPRSSGLDRFAQE